MNKQKNIDATISRKISTLGILCALMVVGVHMEGSGDPSCTTWWMQQILGFGLFAVAVPLFFVVSGYLLAASYAHGQSYLCALKKRVFSLLVPFLFWNLLFASLDLGIIVVNNVCHGRAIFAYVAISGFEWLKVFGIYPFSAPYLGPLWYVRGLLIIVLISPALIYLLRGRFSKFILAAFYCIMYYTMSSFSDNSPWYHFWRWTIPTLGLFYFSIGIFLYGNPISRSIGRPLSILAFPIGLGILILDVYFKYKGISAPVYFRALMIPFLLGGIWYAVPSRELPRLLLNMAFPIYLMHYIFINLCFYFNRDFSTITWYIARGLVGVVCPIVITLLLRRHLPRFASVVFGGR